MKERNKHQKNNRKKIIIVLFIFLAVAAGSTYYFKDQIFRTDNQTTEPGYQTTQVKLGNLVIAASGTGTLIGGKETDLKFTASGTIATINAQVGDLVTEGQELATLADVSELRTNVTLAELDLKSANLTLEQVKNSGPTNLANAQLALAQAKEDLTSAQADLRSAGLARCDQDTTDAYYDKYMAAQEELNTLEKQNDTQDYYLSYIVPAKMKVAQTLATWEYCASYTEYEIDSSHATLALAQAAVQEAQNTLQDLQQNDGIDATELAQAETNLNAAQKAYDSAVTILEGTTIYAPFDGTILSISAEVGDEIGTGAFITIADMKHPEVEFAVDETDLDKVSVGNAVEVVLDSYPDTTINGSVTEIDPSLQTMDGYQVVAGVILLDISNLDESIVILDGLNASVDIIGGEAQNAMLVPVEAVRDLGEGQYGVFVVNSSGKLELKPVEIGLSNATYTEIKSGLEVGDTISIGDTGSLQ